MSSSEPLLVVWKNVVKIENHHCGGPRENLLPEMTARLPVALRKEHSPCSIEVVQSKPNLRVSLWYDCSDYHNLHPTLRAPYVTFPTVHKFTGRFQFICFLTNVSMWISEMQPYRSCATWSTFHIHISFTSNTLFLWHVSCIGLLILSLNFH